VSACVKPSDFKSFAAANLLKYEMPNCTQYIKIRADICLLTTNMGQSLFFHSLRGGGIGYRFVSDFYLEGELFKSKLVVVAGRRHGVLRLASNTRGWFSPTSDPQL